MNKNEAKKINPREVDENIKKISFDDFQVLHDSDELYSKKDILVWDDQMQEDYMVTERRVRPKFMENIDETDPRILLFLLENFKISQKNALEYIRNHDNASVSEDLLVKLMSESGESVQTVFEICIDKCQTAIDYTLFLKRIPSYRFRSEIGRLLISMAIYKNSKNENLIISNELEVQEWLSTSDTYKSKIKMTFNDLRILVLSGAISESKAFYFCDVDINRQPFNYLYFPSQPNDSATTETWVEFENYLVKLQKESQNRFSEIIDFFGRNPLIATALGSIGALNNLLFATKDFKELCSVLIELENRGLLPFLKEFFSDYDEIFYSDVDLLIPYLNRYNNLLDKRRMRRFVKYKGASEENMREEDDKIGLEGYTSTEISTDTFVAKIVGEDRHNTSIYSEKRREKVKKWEISLYRSVGMPQLFLYWQSKELPRSISRGHKDTDVEPNSLLTFWSDVPLVGLPGSSLAFFETNPLLWNELPKYLWKGKMKFSVSDYRYYEIEKFDLHVSSIDEYYLGDVVDEQRCKEPKIFKGSRYGIFQILIFCSKKLNTSEFDDIINTDLFAKERYKKNRYSKTWEKETINNVIFTMLGDTTFMQDVLESQNLKNYDGSFSEEFLRELAEFCIWALDLEVFHEYENDVLRIKSPNSFKNSPSYQGDIVN